MRLPLLSGIFFSSLVCLSMLPVPDARGDECSFAGAPEESSDLVTAVPGPVRITLKQGEAWSFDQICLEVLARWSVNGQTESQVLKSGISTSLRVEGDADGIILVASGNRHSREGYEYRVRFRYDTGTHRFYEAEQWGRDDWDPYVAQVEEDLATGAFSRARERVAERGTSSDGAYPADSEFFLRFARAAHREAERAWRAGRKEAAGRLVHELLAATPVGKNVPAPDEKMYVLGPEEPLNAEHPRGYLVPATGENHELVNNLAFFLSESAYAAQAPGILEQVVKFAPEREVAWLNLGDTYAKTGHPKKAAEAYRRYRTLMTGKGKASRIPERVQRAVK